MRIQHSVLLVTGIAALALTALLWYSSNLESTAPTSDTPPSPTAPAPAVQTPTPEPDPDPLEPAVSTPAKDEDSPQTPAILAFLEIPEELYNSLPEDCYPALESLADYYALDNLDFQELEYQYDEWNRSRGGRDYAEVGQQIEMVVSDYDAYSDELLQDLAKQGDMMAHQLLGQKIMTTHKNNLAQLAKAEFHLTQAATYGSSEAFIGLMYVEKRRTRIARKNNNKPAEIDAIISRNTWREIAHRRGGINLYIDLRAGNLNTLTDEQKQHAKAKAEAVYQSLSGMREARDLPPFDNQLPLAVDMLNSTTEALRDCSALHY